MKNALDLFRLDGKVAVVTGGAGAIGSAIVKALAEAGATVVAPSRDLEHCQAFATEMKQAGLNVEGARCDLASEQEIRGLRDDVIRRHGAVDILFNNAFCGNDPMSIELTTEGYLREAIQTNIFGCYYSIQACFPYLKRKGGRIINFATGAGRGLIRNCHRSCCY